MTRGSRSTSGVSSCLTGALWRPKYLRFMAFRFDDGRF
jgi:hypothetical protein